MVRFSMLSEIGMRENNEDNVGMHQKDDVYCFVLADGLGGHGKGEVASGLAVEAVTEVFASLGKDTFWDQAFLCAQEAIMEGQRADHTAFDMKTTLVVLCVGIDTIRWGHVGDSRLYYFKNKRMEERTLDHSVPQMLADIGEIKEKQIRNHPDRNRLLKVLGVETDELKYQLGEPVPVEGDQAFLLCTDGFWELIGDKKMESTLKRSSSPEEWLKAMEAVVIKNGRGRNMDNYSAIAVWTT